MNIQKSAAQHRKFEAGVKARELAKKLDNAVVKVPVRVGENGKMFGTVSGKEVAAAIEEQLGLTVDKKKISLDPVRSTGEYVAKLSLFEEVKANLKVIVEEQK
jgi:large subunit ribosomal protein L9